MRCRAALASAAVAAALVATAGGCGGSSTPTSAAGHTKTGVGPSSPPAVASTTTAATGSANPDVRTLVTLADARSVLGASATQFSSCSADDCNYVTDGGLGVVGIAAATGASQQDFATSTQGYTPFTGTGTGDAAAYKIQTNGTGEVTFLHGSLLINISVRIAGPAETITPVTASALQQLATSANGRI